MRWAWPLLVVLWAILALSNFFEGHLALGWAQTALVVLYSGLWLTEARS